MTETREQFLAERRKYLGASDIAAVMGLDPYQTPLDVFNQKMGFVEPFEGNSHTKRGTKLEEIAAREYTEQTGNKLRRKRTALVHPKYPFIRGHLDRLVEGLDRIAEIKIPGVGNFAKVKREGLPDSWIIQLQGYLGLSRKKAGEYIIFNSDRWELLNFEVEAQPDLYEQIEHAAVVFWSEHVLKGVPPPALEADKPKLEFARVNGEVKRIEDPEFLEAAELLQEAKQLELDGKQLYDIAKQRIIEAIGGYGKFQGGGLRLSYYESPGHASFDKKALQREHPGINLERYEKRGNSFPVFRPFWINQKD